MIRRQRIAGALTLMVLTVASQAETFIRVDEDKTAARLQTAVTRYEKDGASVDLIGAIHIADKAYYGKLSERFKTYDALLFEMIGGEKVAALKKAAAAPPKPAAPVEGAKKERDLSGLRKVYDMAAKYLDLSGQLECIDYTAPNFVHADLTNAEFNELQKQRGESLLGFALKAAKTAPENSKEPDSMKLLSALISGKSNRVKLEIVHTLGQSDSQIAAFVGESVIISDRNQRCMEVLDRELARGHKNLGVFYGAAHFPDMEKRLLEHGFKRVKQDWLTAWDIPKKDAKPAPAKKEAA